MFPGSISLALCTVVIRRCFDALSGRIPAPAPVSNAANVTTMFMVSGALIYLYSQLRRGTLVSIGQGQRHCLGSKNISLRGSKHNRSWFLKNLWGKRKCCTDAIFKIAKQFSDSVTNLNPCLLLPKETFQVSFPNDRESLSRNNMRENPSRTQERERLPRLDSFNDITVENSDSCEVIFSKEAELSPKKPFRKRSNSNPKEIGFNAGGDNFDMKKRHLRSVIKRLEPKKKLQDGSVKQSKQSVKFQSEHCRTRSGRVYNPFN